MLATLEKILPRTPISTDRILTPDEAVRLIRARKAPDGICVNGHLSLAGDNDLTELPQGLTAPSLDVSGCFNLTALPEGLTVRRIDASGCKSLRHLPRDLRCNELDLQGTAVETLPSDLRVAYRLNLSACSDLRELPVGLKTGSLVLQECTRLRALPEGLDVYFLDISGCSGLKTWPRRASLKIGRLNARDCSGLTDLPPWLAQVSQLDLRGCMGLTELPEGLIVSSWVDLADTGITSLPMSMANAALRWRGVPIDSRVAFEPQTITAAEVLGTANAELRRVKLERMGYEAFMLGANAQELDRDTDPGGERRLLRVPLDGDEDLVCISVFCPSTGRQYIIRVPPRTATCRQAAAWIAGYDNADDYRPIAET